jgi:hypothetical protein
MKEEETKKKLLRKSNDSCVYCSRSIDLKTMTIDHIRPKSKGGSNAIYNLAASCYQCNNLKSNIEYETFIKLIKEEDGIEKIKNLIRENNKNNNIVESFRMKCNSISSLAKHISKGCADDLIYGEIKEYISDLNAMFNKILELRYDPNHLQDCEDCDQKT